MYSAQYVTKWRYTYFRQWIRMIPRNHDGLFRRTLTWRPVQCEDERKWWRQAICCHITCPGESSSWRDRSWKCQRSRRDTWKCIHPILLEKNFVTYGFNSQFHGVKQAWQAFVLRPLPLDNRASLLVFVYQWTLPLIPPFVNIRWNWHEN